MEQAGYSMDKPREGDPRRRYRHVAWGAVAVAVIAGFVVADRLWLRPGAGIELDEFMTAAVERGTLSIEVQGAGELEPVNERLIASETPGAVDRIFARAGEQVALGDRIVGLMNPQVRQGVVAARLQLAEANADHRRRLADFTDRRLAGEAQIPQQAGGLRGVAAEARGRGRVARAPGRVGDRLPEHEDPHRAGEIGPGVRKAAIRGVAGGARGGTDVERSPCGGEGIRLEGSPKTGRGTRHRRRHRRHGA